VWLLEDSATQAEALIVELSRSYRVRHFLDSRFLLETLQNEQPDVLVLDWEIPDISGLEVLRVLRKTRDQVALPVLMITSHRERLTLVDAMRAGANDFVLKPYDAVELLARVGTLARVRALYERSARSEHELAQALQREEAARRQAEGQQRSLFALFMQAPVAVALLQGPEQVCVYLNDAFRTLLDGRDVLHRPLAEALPELHGSSIHALLARVFTRGEPFSANELALALGHHRGGDYGVFNFTFVPKRSVSNEVDGILVVAADVTEQVRARQRTEALAAQLQVGESELRAVTDALPVLVSYVAPDERYGLVNKAYEHWFGTKADDLLGRSLVDVVGPAAYAVLSPYVKRALAGERLSFEQYNVPYRLGGVRDIRVDMVPRWNAAGEGNGYVALLQDITAERAAATDRDALLTREQASRAEAQAQRDAQHQLFMQAAMPIAILEGPEHVFTFANPAYVELVNGRQVVGKPLHEALPDVREFGFDTLMDRVMETGETSYGNEQPIRLEHHTGDEILIMNFVYAPKRDATGKVDGVLMSGWDVTEQSLARRRVQDLAIKLGESEQQMRTLVEASGAGLWSLDIATRRVEADERAAAMMGLAEQRSVGLAEVLSALIDPADQQRVADALEGALDGQLERLVIDFRTTLVAGRSRWLEGRAQVIADSLGTRRTLAGALLDVTERKRLEEQREQARELERDLRRAAEHASGAKDEFMAMLGHELRNPLAPILTALELMRMRDGEHLVEERAIIERQTRHMVRLVDDLLDVSRIASGKVELRLERVELGDIIARAVETAAPLIEQNRHQLTVLVPLSGWPVKGDAARLTQVFSNLLTNAAKYTEAGGSIRVSVERHGARVSLSVTDSGRGIAPDMLARVFELFSQERQNLDRSQGGLGLGLAIVKSLTELHGGRVAVVSEGAGRGTTFTVDLPLARSGASSQSLPPAGSHVAAPTTPIRVLIVDDNEDAAYLLAAALAQRGCQTRIAHDAEGAHAAFEREVPDVAVLDIGLPLVDGYTLAVQLRQRYGQTIRLVALTGYGQEEDRRKSAEAGFDRHLVKPVEVAELLRTVRELVAAHRAQS